MKSFADFWALLISNTYWYEQTSVKYSRKNIKDVAQKFYIDLLAQPEEWKTQNYDKWRRTFQKWLMWEPDKDVAPQLQQAEEPKQMSPEEAEKNKPLTGEARQIWLEKFKAQVLATPPIKPVAKISTREIISEGQWDAKKEPVHINGIDADLFRLNEAIKKYGRRKYMSLYSFSGFQTFKFGLVDVFAANETDAKEILSKAERYCKLKKLV